MTVEVDEWLLRREAAKYLGVSFSTLAHMASRSEGPRFFLYGNKARYLKSDLNDWIRSKAIEPLSPALQEYSRRRRNRDVALGFGS